MVTLVWYEYDRAVNVSCSLSSSIPIEGNRGPFVDVFSIV